MGQTQLLTTPPVTTGMPPGIPYIIGNEAAERFSYYGMRAILVVFMTKFLHNNAGELAVMSDADAKSWYHLFVSSAYFFPMLGAVLADAWWGKYRTILWLSVVYCLGHLALSVDDTRVGLAVGLFLIALGSGGIKPCVSANVGDQFGPANSHLLEKVFGWFYFSINFGSFFSTILTPWLLVAYGPYVAFAVPGVLMLLATIVFRLGKYHLAHVPPAGLGFVRDATGPEGRRTLGKLILVFAFITMFWALYDQTGSAWILQAEGMNRNWLGREWLAAQIHAVNPILILIYIPLFSYLIYPALNRVFPLTPLRKMSIGMFITAVSFTVPAWIESRIVAGEHPHMIWQIVAYLIITAAEVMVWITMLEFAYTQAPKKLKSLVMALSLLTVSLGNLLASGINALISKKIIALEGANYYWFFAGLMTLAAIAFAFVARGYREENFIQDDALPVAGEPA